MKGDALDPKALIREAYRIERIGAEECRSIFVDWALSLTAPGAAEAALPALLERYGAAAPDHPMTAVLREGLAGAGGPGGPRRRRGGWRARRGVTGES